MGMTGSCAFSFFFFPGRFNVARSHYAFMPPLALPGRFGGARFFLLFPGRFGGPRSHYAFMPPLALCSVTAAVAAGSWLNSLIINTISNSNNINNIKKKNLL